MGLTHIEATITHPARPRRGVIFGEKGDSVLLGAVSLEALGMILDPMKRELRPLPMLLARQARPRA